MSSETATLGTVRPWLLAEITPHLPAGWDAKPGLVTPGEIIKPTVYCEYHALDRKDLPPGFVTCHMRLIVVDERKDISTAEDVVDAHVLELILSLTNDARLTWTGARKSVEFAPYLGWEIDVDVIAGLHPPDP